MKVLFYVEKFSYPANDGVTASIASLCRMLKKRNATIDVCCNTINHGSNVVNKVITKGEPDFTQYDYIVASPILSAKKCLALLKKNKCDTKVVSLLNDVYSYVLYRNIFVCLRIRHLDFKDIMKLVVIPYYYFIEKTIAKNSHAVLYQTNKDVRVAKKLFGKELNISVLSNIQEYDNFDVRQINKQRDGIGFVATFEGSYKKIAMWFIEKVWLLVLENNPNKILYLCGKNNAEFRLEVISKYSHIQDSICASPYYEKMSDFYLNKDIIVSPIFKGYGLINKTVEAMYFGCKVIGDKHSFNGIPNIIDNTNVVIAETANDFIERISSISRETNEKMRINAHELIKNEFSSVKFDENLDSIFGL